MYLPARFVCCPLIAFLLLGWARLEADEVEIVLPKVLANQEGDGLFWDGVVPAAHAQWVIDASQFSEVPEGYTLITQAAVRPDASVKSTRKVVTPDLELRLSTTDVMSFEQDWEFATNLGDDVTLVHDGRHEGTQHGSGPAGGPREFDHIVPFYRPFAYDPSRGNLLIDWQQSAQSAPLLLDGDSSVAQVGSEIASQSGAHVVNAEYQQGLLLVMQFTFARPSGDYDLNDVLDVHDIDALSAAARTGANDLAFDLNADQLVSEEDRTVWVQDFKKTWFGDANLDGQFDGLDLVSLLQAGEYEDDVWENSTWATGDWNADGEFDRADLVLALQDGGYGQGPRTGLAAVPEPASGPLLALGVLLAGGCFRIGRARRNAGVKPPRRSRNGGRSPLSPGRRLERTQLYVSRPGRRLSLVTEGHLRIPLREVRGPPCDRGTATVDPASATCQDPPADRVPACLV